MNKITTSILLLSILLYGCKHKLSPQRVVETKNQKINKYEMKVVDTLVNVIPPDNSFNNFKGSNVNLVGHCDEPLEQEFNKVNVNSEKDYVLKLYEIYNSEIEYNKFKSNNSNLGVLSTYGSLDFENKKKSITATHEKYMHETFVGLDYSEKLAISKVFASDATIQMRLEAWNNCNALNAGKPYLDIIDNSEGEIALTLDLPPNRQGTKKTKVLSIQHSSNMEAVNFPLKEGDKVKYGNPYNFKMTRKDIKSGWFSVSLEKEIPLTIQIPAIIKEPVVESYEVNEMVNFSLIGNVSDNYIDCTMPNGEVKKLGFKNQHGPSYNLSLEIETPLTNTNGTKITDAFYKPGVGGMKTSIYQGYKVSADNKLILCFYLKTSKKKFSGTLSIVYQIVKQRCIANCK